MSPPDGIPERLERLKCIAPAGFAIALHVRFTTPTYLFQTYPPAWIEEYSRLGLVLRDPNVAWSFTHVGTKPWAELADQDPTGVFQRAAAHGLAHGVAAAVERDGSRSLAGFARADRPFTLPEREGLLQELAALHDATAATAPLPPDTREALRRMSVAFTHP